jgi:hypothetical protein
VGNKALDAVCTKMKQFFPKFHLGKKFADDFYEPNKPELENKSESRRIG